MAILKTKDIEKMSKTEIESKIKELKTELIKSKVSAKKTSKLSTKEIKKTIARLLTINNKLKEMLSSGSGGSPL